MKDHSTDGMRHHLLIGLVVVTLLVLGLGSWAATAQFAGAIIAQGTVVVQSNVKKVQHPTGGVIGEIRVKEGDEVSAGDLLVRLDETVTRANLQIVSGQVDELIIRQARLIAERDGRDSLAVPEEISARITDPKVAEMIGGERGLLQSRRQALLGKKAQLSQRIAQLRKEVEGLVAQQTAKETEIKLIARELAGLFELQKRDLVPSIKVTALEREQARLSGERGQLMAAEAQTEGRITEIELQITQLDQDTRAEVTKELRDLQAKHAELAERRVAAEDQLKRVELRSPQSGRVHQLNVHTVGGVINPSEPLMLIVPEGDELVVEAKLAPQDIDNVAVGQRAVVRFSGINARTTPEIEAKVSRVAADLTRDVELQQAYYLMRIGLPQDSLAKLDGLRLVPGMPAEVHVQTGERTMMAYLMKPLSDQYARAFTEQ